MRRIIPLIIAVVSLTCFIVPARVSSQGSVRTAIPPIVKVELSGIEPLPSGVAAQISYESGAGGWGDQLPSVNNIQWVTVPRSIEYPRFYDNKGGAELVACGYAAKEKPVAILTYPDKHSETRLSIEEVYSSAENNSGCWSYSVQWSYGMELGEYTFTLDSPSKRLSHTWRIEFPKSPFISDISRSLSDTSKQAYMFMGFSPYETLLVRFYTLSSTDISRQIIGYFVASRVIQADGDGVIILEINITHSAPFTTGQIDFQIDGYTKRFYGVIRPPIYNVEKLSNRNSSQGGANEILSVF